ncbi:MAG: Flp pilus assembly complex ATPase component TadA [Candidatus Riflebacteria bacterium]|nr:Flp pilus assembly complex ATPase component TadA [Candidatus Riflebacteria bacterium]
MSELLKTVADVRKSGATDIHLSAGEKIFVRRGGVLSIISDHKVTEDEIKKVILATSTPKAREILGKNRQVNYTYEDGVSKERYRVAASFCRGKFALAIRMLPAQPPKMADLGLPDAIRKVLAKQSGLIMVGSPSGQGKTTTIASLLDFINTHYEKHIITVENPVEIKFKDDRSSFLQRGIGLDVPNFFGGLDEAYRLDPDVVMTDSLNYRDALDQAMFLCEAGCLVIGATEGGSCQHLLERVIHWRSAEEHDGFRGKIATHLSMIISQRLVPRADEKGLVAVFDIMVNTQQVKAMIKNDNLSMIKTIQEQDQASGMQTFDRHLQTLVKKNVITSKTAVEYAEDITEMSARFTSGKG